MWHITLVLRVTSFRYDDYKNVAFGRTPETTIYAEDPIPRLYTTFWIVTISSFWKIYPTTIPTQHSWPGASSSIPTLGTHQAKHLPTVGINDLVILAHKYWNTWSTTHKAFGSRNLPRSNTIHTAFRRPSYKSIGSQDHTIKDPVNGWP